MMMENRMHRCTRCGESYWGHEICEPESGAMQLPRVHLHNVPWWQRAQLHTILVAGFGFGVGVGMGLGGILIISIVGWP